MDSFVNEWLRHCEALHQNPMHSVDILLALADIDRYCKNRHGLKELDAEQRAYIVHRRKTEGLKAVDAIRQT